MNNSVIKHEKQVDTLIVSPLFGRSIYFFGIVTGIMFCMGIYTLVSLFINEEGRFSIARWGIGSWASVAFMLVWLSFVIYGFYNGCLRRIGYTLTFDGEGVRESRRFLPELCKSLAWQEIQSYGYYYEGTQRNSPNLYTVYFSPELSEPKGKYRRRIPRTAIRVTIPLTELEDFTDEVFPICQSHLSTEPETVVIKDHFF